MPQPRQSKKKPSISQRPQKEKDNNYATNEHTRVAEKGSMNYDKATNTT